MTDRDRETLADALAACKGERAEIQLRTGQTVPGVVDEVLPGKRAFRLLLDVLAKSPDGKSATRVGQAPATYLVADVAAVIGPMPAPEQRRIAVVPGLPPVIGAPVRGTG